jgi:hypothetical protein
MTLERTKLTVGDGGACTEEGLPAPHSRPARSTRCRRARAKTRRTPEMHRRLCLAWKTRWENGRER